MNPKMVAQNRTARLVREASTPVYSTDTASAAQRERVRRLRWAEGYTGPDFCHVCGRATDHFAEHSDEQLLAFYNGKGSRFRR